MPENHFARFRPAVSYEPNSPAAVPYAELHCRTNFSFLEGASHAEELVATAAGLGYRALAITDRNSLAGVVRAHTAAREVGLKLLIGAEITPQDAPSLLVFAPNRAAYGRLCRLITVGRRNAEKGSCCLTFRDVAEHSDGLIAGILLGNAHRQTRSLSEVASLFPQRCYGIAEVHAGADDEQRLGRALAMAQQLRIPLAAANDVHYHVPERRFLHDVLTAIRLRKPVHQLGRDVFPNGERSLKSPAEMKRLFAKIPGALERTVELADRCDFSLDELRYEYPEELTPQGVDSFDFLEKLTLEGAKDRYPAGVPAKVRKLVEHELSLIKELRYEDYFLTVWDLVRFARRRGILCQGRGSAANSAVCFCLGVTSVDPDRIDVLFERFVSKERNEAPDIDVDFEHERREEVLQYLYEKYGRDRAGLAATVITYRPRSAVRDVGKALGMPQDRIDLLAKSVAGPGDEEEFLARFREAGVDPQTRFGSQLVWLIREILGFPRHLSQHVGGMVMTRGLLSELVPIENAAMPDRTVIQWDKDDLESLGMLKVDCLGLGMLSAIRKCFAMIEQHHNRRLNLATVPAEDPAVYNMVCRADTVGVFQIESRAQMSMLPRLKPRCFYDLVIEVAIVRPGPIQGNMVHPYLRRRNGQEPVDYPNEDVREVLHKTLGVPIFQEQAMRLAVVAAGFSPGEADQLRRAMGAWRKRGIMEKFQTKLIEGMQANGYSDEFATNVIRQIQGFGEYGFPESHSASFALLVYVSAWMKRYYPAAFAAALINSQPMGFYAPAQLIRDAREHDVPVHPVDVNFSQFDCTLEEDRTQDACRLGFRLISGFREADAQVIVEARRTGGPFSTVEEFADRTGLSNASLQKLAAADAFASLKQSRREATWASLVPVEARPLYASHADDHEPVELPSMTHLEEVIADYRTVGLSLRGHPMQFLRSWLQRAQVVPCAKLGSLPNGTRCEVAGLVLLRQRPSTAKGITFVTLEDETGIANLIIRQEIWSAHRHVARGAIILSARGIVQKEGLVIHLLAHSLRDWSELLSDLQQQSRDFR